MLAPKPMPYTQKDGTPHPDAVWQIDQIVIARSVTLITVQGYHNQAAYDEERPLDDPNAKQTVRVPTAIRESNVPAEMEEQVLLMAWSFAKDLPRLVNSEGEAIEPSFFETITL